MTGELSRADVKDISSEMFESYKDIKPEKEMSFREINEFVETEFDKAAKEAETRGVVVDSEEKGLSEEDSLKITEESQKEYDKADKENEFRVVVDDLEKNNLSDLSDEERLKIKEETNWSDELIDYIKNMKQYEIYKNADLYEVEIDGKKCLVKKIDMDYVDPKTGLTNRELMERGRAPYDSKTGEKIELHHMNQEYDAPLVELCENSEHGDGNDSILHPKKGESWRKDPELKGNYENKDRPNHWKERSREA